MKATLIPEAPVFTLEFNGMKLTGMRESGQLGPVIRLNSELGHEAYVVDCNSPIAKAFRFFNEDASRGVTLVACNPKVMDFFYPPQADPSPPKAG